MQIIKDLLFIIFPYLNSDSPIELRGIMLWPSQLLDTNSGLSDDEKNHLRILTSLFYFQNGSSVRKMLYAISRPRTKHDVSDLNKHLIEIRALLGYLYGSPQHGGSPDRSYEQFDVYLFQSYRFPKSALDIREDGSKTDNSNNAQVLPDQYIDGYDGLLNFQIRLLAAEGVHFYPSIPDFRPVNRGLFTDLRMYFRQEQSWPLQHLIHIEQNSDEDFSERIFTAMEWYNRSGAKRASEDVSVIDLAVAFETLFSLEKGDTTEQFKAFLTSLLGKSSRLESWAHQFYDARSKLVHQGRWRYLAYYPIDIPSDRKMLEKQYEQIKPTMSLTETGRNIFRICMLEILSGHFIAEKNDLHLLLYDNKDRLQTIQKKLAEDLLPKKKIQNISREVKDLHENAFEWEPRVSLNEIISVGKALLEVYLAVQDPLFSPMAPSAQAIIDATKNVDDAAQLKNFVALEAQLSIFGTSDPDGEIQILRKFLDYAQSQGGWLEVRSRETK